MIVLMLRKKGRGGPSQSSPEREVETNQTESESEGNMDDNKDTPKDSMIRLLNQLNKGQEEANQNWVETTHRQDEMIRT
jgi:hypothetical protein